MERQLLADVLGLPREDLFSVLTHAVPGFVWLTGLDGKVLFANQSWLDYTGLTAKQTGGYGWLHAVHPDDARQVPPIWHPENGELREQYDFQMRFRRHDGEYRWHKVCARPVAGHTAAWIGCAVDIQDQIDAQELQDDQVRILEMVASGAPLDDVLAALCLLAERQLPDAHCSILLVDTDNGVFTGAVAPSLSLDLSIIPGVKIGTGVGSCGTAAYERRDVVVSDISTDPLWETWRDFALSNGLHSCWSRPIYGTDGKVLATLAFYFTEIRSPTPDEMARMSAIQHIASVVIERTNVLRALKESEEHYRYAVDLNPQIPWTADPEGNILTISSRWEGVTGVKPEDALGQKWLEALHPDDLEGVIAIWREKLSSGEQVDVQFRIRLKDGSYRWARARGAARRDDDGDIVRWYGTLEDINEYKLAEEKLQRAAYEDDLTRLPNRRWFEEKLAETLAEADKAGQRVGLLILDVDDFKQVNDRFGHPTGDAVLRLLAHHLRDAITPNKLVARLGGDEFAVVLQAIAEEEDVLNQAQAIGHYLDGQLKRNAKSRNSHVSIGCVASDAGDSADELFKKADLALSATKSTKKGTVKLFTQEIRVQNRQRFSEIELAREALRNGWIVPYYQPKISLADGRIVGVEALIRIAHPREGILGPEKILAALDSPDSDIALNDRMMSLVIHDIADWHHAGVRVGSTAVNVCAECVNRPHFSDELLASLETAGLPFDALKLEITERVLIDDLGDDIHRSLEELRGRGIRISLDDFGTGYAALTHLRRFPVDEIKIDRSFLEDLTSDNGNSAIVKAMINLGKNLGIEVVAEGIETLAQALVLRSWGCEIGQGYYFDKPIPADQIPATVRRHNSPTERKRWQLAVARDIAEAGSLPPKKTDHRKRSLQQEEDRAAEPPPSRPD
ncbi:MAG TPA: hypothetical protein DIC56_02810 [Rhizobium sp.]|nr:hypothetical protein [Rhizobium sp.]